MKLPDMLKIYRGGVSRLKLDGVDDTFYITDFAVKANDNITFFIDFVYVDYPGKNIRILDHDAVNSFYLNIPNRQDLSSWNGTTNIKIPILSKNTRYKIVVVYGSSKYFMVANGVKSSVYTRQPFVAGSYRVSFFRDFPQSYFNNFGLWNRELTTDEINKLMK